MVNIFVNIRHPLPLPAGACMQDGKKQITSN